jgi:hypothetical protein
MQSLPPKLQKLQLQLTLEYTAPPHRMSYADAARAAADEVHRLYAAQRQRIQPVDAPNLFK